jgi:hypothetical protein
MAKIIRLKTLARKPKSLSSPNSQFRNREELEYKMEVLAKKLDEISGKQSRLERIMKKILRALSWKQGKPPAF